MEIAEHLRECLAREWLIGLDNQKLSIAIEQNVSSLSRLIANSTAKLKVLIVEEEAIEFIAAYFACLISGVDLFLCNPNWQEKEWVWVFNLVKPDLIFGECNIRANIPNISISDRQQKIISTQESLIMIPTGGSSGQIKFAMHTFSTLAASVCGFCQYFQLKTINSFCILPLYHVSGLMQLMRSFLTKGNLVVVSYKELKRALPNNINTKNYFISLVPTQLRFLGELSPQWLANFHTVLLGGAAISPSILNEARKDNIPLAPTYGMTETASQIVTLKPQDFLQGNNSVGLVLPHAQVSIIDKPIKKLSANSAGLIRIKTNSLFLGYYPQKFTSSSSFITDDLGYFDKQNYLFIIGRNSRKIISGGENIFPTEIEAAILATKLVKDVCVLGLPDEYWGEAVTALYVPLTSNINPYAIEQKLRSRLSKYKHPKNWVLVDSLLRCDRGKLNYPKLTDIAQDRLKQNKTSN